MGNGGHSDSLSVLNMPAITATAPGKIILFGEHAVVYGEPAIAAPVMQVRARAVVSAQPNRPPGWINLQAPDIGLDTIWDDLAQDHPLHVLVKLVLEAIHIDPPPALTLRITSTIPIASGLGSGAAVSVSVIRALTRFLGRTLPDDNISELAFEVEKLHHGSPSGIDNTVVTFEKPIYYRRKLSAGKGEMQPIEVPEPFTIVIGDTGISSPTAAAVADVHKSWQADQEGFEELFRKTGEIAHRARQAIEDGNLNALGPLMNENQEMLIEMGVSSPDLEQLIHAARRAGAHGAKLSGGGRGGNMIALVSQANQASVAQALSRAGAVNIITTKVSSTHEGEKSS